jgi:hypothetical protein
MDALQKHDESVTATLQSIQDVNCISGFDILAPDVKFLDDKEFFTGTILWLYFQYF